jgi:hypothetical protein
MLPARRSRPLNNQSHFLQRRSRQSCPCCFTKVRHAASSWIVTVPGRFSATFLHVLQHADLCTVTNTSDHRCASYHKIRTQAQFKAARFEPAAVTPFASIKAYLSTFHISQRRNSLSDNAPFVDVVRSTDERWRAHERVDNHMFIRMIRRNHRQCLN